MNYNDSQIMSDSDYIQCQSAYCKLSENTIHDLGEILEKLESQKRAINSTETISNRHRILGAIDDSISSLKSIMQTSQKSSQSAPLNTHKAISKFSQKHLKQNTDTPPYTYSENRGDSISNYMGNSTPSAPIPSSPITNPQNTTPSSPTPVPSDNIAPDGRLEPRSRALSRGCPQPGNFIAKLLSQLKVSTPKVHTQKDNKYGYSVHSIHSEILGKTGVYVTQNRHIPHHPPHHICTPEREILSRQIDIVRLLILYLQLRPNYPYCYRICSIASTQFDILSTLIDI